MNIYLARNGTEVPSGVMLISDLSTLEKLVDNAECTEIMCDDFLSLVKFEDLGQAIALIISKLRLNGKLIILQTDFDLLNFKYHRQEIDIHRVNTLLFNGQSIVSVFTLRDVNNLMEQFKLKVESVKYDHNNCRHVLCYRREQ